MVFFNGRGVSLFSPFVVLRVVVVVVVCLFRMDGLCDVFDMHQSQ